MTASEVKKYLSLLQDIVVMRRFRDDSRHELDGDREQYWNMELRRAEKELNNLSPKWGLLL